MKNIDLKTVESFGEEWLRYDQSGMEERNQLDCLKIIFQYFHGTNYQSLQKVLIWGVGVVDGPNL